ncbi:MAG: alpha/beta hydrolase [Haliscomenobacteraceae bacterium CHB4]|nr:Acetyl esterase [Saprospiraceae bacterium]MCE7924712.1 alpha/beta hydrolase [Haliscomenobacteraceae bacterium CHB4]
METLQLVIQILAIVSGCLAAVISILLFVRLRWPSPVLWFIKLYASALSPLLALIGVFSTIVGTATYSSFISLVGSYVVLVYFIHIVRVTRPPDVSGDFEQAFGPDWENRIKPGQKNYFLPGRTVLRLPVVPKPRCEQNIPFSTIPGTNRQLLCDVWQPPENVSPSGIAFIYLHGSAWYFLDKDLGTRPLFGHLAAQGHVIMDVAYRLAPETDMMGMINDVKQAIVWIKENAGTYGVNPNRIVVGGGSAGGHLALMAAFTANNPQFLPKELEGKDVSVCAVISLYGPTDLEAMYYHTNQHLTTRETPGRPKKAVPTQMPEWMKQRMGAAYYRLGFDKGFVNAGAFAPLMGGHPDECPETYTLFSPVTHVHSDCPPTLLIHGEHDIMSPVKTTRILYTHLVEAKVPTVLHILPQTDHAFDLQLPNISPSAHNALYDVERFITLIAASNGVNTSLQNGKL